MFTFGDTQPLGSNYLSYLRLNKCCLGNLDDNFGNEMLQSKNPILEGRLLRWLEVAEAR